MRPWGSEDSQVSDLIESKNTASPDATIGIMMDKERVNNLLDIMNDREKEILGMPFRASRQQNAYSSGGGRNNVEIPRKARRQIEEAALKKNQEIITAQESEI